MEPAPPKRIGISLGNIGALHDGLGEFAWQIGQRIAAVAPQWRAQYGIGIDFHMRSNLGPLFGPEVGYLHVKRWHRWHHVQSARYALWHSLHQLTKNKPPVGAAQRLVTVHDLNYLYGRSAWSTWRRGNSVRALLSRTDQIVTISQHTADDVSKHLGWKGPMQVVHNGARSFVGQAQTPLPGWSDTPQTPFLFHLSRMSASKNPQAIIELARQWPGMRFVLCGPPTKDAQHLSRTVALPNLEFHLGITEAQKAWAFANCSGFLFPSLTEGFGLPPVEAMHFGKPVFLSRRTSLPEVGGTVADYFDDFSPHAMRAVVDAGLARAAQPGHADAVRAHASQFDWDRAAQRYLDLYRQLLGLPPR